MSIDITASYEARGQEIRRAIEEIGRLEADRDYWKLRASEADYWARACHRAEKKAVELELELARLSMKDGRC